MVKAVIFDCFGVLVGKGFDHTYRTAGGDPGKDKPFIQDVLGQANMGMISDQEFREAMAKQVGVSIDDWRAAVKAAEQPDLNLLTYIKGLRGEYKTAVLSNANNGSLDRKIGQALLNECFDDVIVSADIGMVKPDPRIYKFAAERLGVALDECVFIDDSEYLLAPAGEMGMRTILFKNTPELITKLDKILANPES